MYTYQRFFFPWPRQPQQQYDENTDRIALERQLPEDDQWVVPHELRLAMFSPSTVNVLPFDPDKGSCCKEGWVRVVGGSCDYHGGFGMEWLFDVLRIRSAQKGLQMDSEGFGGALG